MNLISRIARRWADNQLIAEADRLETLVEEMAEEMEEQDQELADLRADYDKQAAENLALHTRCADLTDQVEAHERQAKTDA